MKILFYSDIHLALGPREPIKPEMRRIWCKFGWCGNRFMNRFEDRLRLEARRVRAIAGTWMQRFSHEYDFLINGGDLAMPLTQHKDRIAAARTIWIDELQQYGESRILFLTGNHELGHGYDVEPACYSDFMNLRNELFHRELNRKGFGLFRIEEVNLLFIDSELVAMHEQVGDDEYIDTLYREQTGFVEFALLQDAPVVIFTHNTARIRKWIRRELGLWAQLVRGGRNVAFIGGHFHIPRSAFRDGAEIHWTGGGSYPEPLLRYLVRLPFTGIKPWGPGAVEVEIENGKFKITHRAFGVSMSIRKSKRTLNPAA